MTWATSCLRREGIVPISVEVVASEVDGGKLGVGDFDAFGIFVFVEFGADGEACCGGGRGNQLHNGFEAAQRLTAPVGKRGKSVGSDADQAGRIRALT